MRGDKIDIPEIPDMNLAKAKCVNHPQILRVSITVFVSPESMGNTLERINNRAGKIVGRIDLPLSPVGEVRRIKLNNL